MSNAAATARHPVLDKAEWALVMELLERERREIPVEMHHTATHEFRQRLRDRLKVIDALLERLRVMA